MAIEITNGINKHPPRIDSLLIFGRDTLIHRTTKEEYYWMLMFEENIENLLFEWRVKTADDNRVGIANRFCPSNTSAFGLWCDRARSEKGYKMSLQQISISERTHKKA